jgi:hypothetical protein
VPRALESAPPPPGTDDHGDWHAIQEQIPNSSAIKGATVHDVHRNREQEDHDDPGQRTANGSEQAEIQIAPHSATDDRTHEECDRCSQENYDLPDSTRWLVAAKQQARGVSTEDQDYDTSRRAESGAT